LSKILLRHSPIFIIIFPTNHCPDIYFFVSGFNHQFLVTDTILGVGTDLYLGADYPLYPDITYEYLIPNMRYEMLVPDLINTWLHQIFPFQGKNDVLSHMLYEGKILYLTRIFLPNTSKNLLIGYEPATMNWCKAHEKQIWASMLENRHLFSTGQLLITPVDPPGTFYVSDFIRITRKIRCVDRVANRRKLYAKQQKCWIK